MTNALITDVLEIDKIINLSEIVDYFRVGLKVADPGVNKVSVYGMCIKKNRKLK